VLAYEFFLLLLNGGAWETKFWVVATNIFCVIIAVFSLHSKIYISSHAPSRKHHIIVEFTVHSIIVGCHYRACFILLFWHLEFGGGCSIFGKFLDPFIEV
jgi:hypothetical protein